MDGEGKLRVGRRACLLDVAIEEPLKCALDLRREALGEAADGSLIVRLRSG